MKYIDNFLNSLTMYRLVLYGLSMLYVFALGLAFAGLLPFSVWQLLLSAIVLIAGCIVSNSLLARIFRIPANVESSYITAFILILILPPPTSSTDVLLSLLVAVVAMASKYVVNIGGKHIFNPVALAAVLLSLSGLGATTWWVGSSVLLVPTAIIGLLMVRKVRWSWLFLTFTFTALLTIAYQSYINNSPVSETLMLAILSGPLLFFGSIMLTEPSTTPPTKGKQMVYGALVGVLYGTPFNIGPLYNAPELGLILGNIYSYIVSPKGRLLIYLKEKVQYAPLMYDFVFETKQKLKFTAGQYMEWTITPQNSDSRGNRRFFTVASAPTENDLRIGVKIPEQASTFKQYLQTMQPGDPMVVGHLSGDFTLPKNNNQTIVAIAGGIGITPFRSMVKEAIDQQHKLDMVIFYACSDAGEFVYQDIFKQAEPLGLKTIYVLSGGKTIPENWKGLTGYLTADIVNQHVSNPKKSLFYLSGPNVMVDAYKKLLLSMGVARQQIHTDYFPGY